MDTQSAAGTIGVRADEGAVLGADAQGLSELDVLERGAREEEAEGESPELDAADAEEEQPVPLSGDAWVEGNTSNPLALWVLASVNQPLELKVAAWSASELLWESAWSERGLEHRVAVLGLRPGVEVELHLHIKDEAGEEILWQSLAHTSALLAPTLPSISASTYLQGERAPGWTFFGLQTRGEEVDPSWPLYMAVDAHGVPRWVYQDDALSHEGVVRDVRLLDSGDLMLLLPEGVRIVGFDGETRFEWLEGENLPEAYHHDARVLPWGNIVILGREVRTLALDSLAGEYDVRGDTLKEFDEEGQLVWSWSTFDHLDTERLPGPLSSVPNQQGGFLDWTHANSLSYAQESDTFLVSLRHQNQVIRLSRGDGEVLERIGDGGDYTLQSGEWFYSQHSPELDAEGGLLIYDNGNERPDESGRALLPKAERYSRAVYYALDPLTKEATQLWSYTMPEFTAFVGGIERLSTGNVLVCAGGVRGSKGSGLARLHEVVGTAPALLIWSLEVEGFVYRARRLELPKL